MRLAGHQMAKILLLKDNFAKRKSAQTLETLLITRRDQNIFWTKYFQYCRQKEMIPFQRNPQQITILHQICRRHFFKVTGATNLSKSVVDFGQETQKLLL